MSKKKQLMRIIEDLLIEMNSFKGELEEHRDRLNYIINSDTAYTQEDAQLFDDSRLVITIINRILEKRTN